MNGSLPRPRGHLHNAPAVMFILALGSLLASVVLVRVGLLNWGLGALGFFYLAFASYSIIWLVLLLRRKLGWGDIVMAVVLGLSYWVLRYVAELAWK